jgi:hypothetical protein
LISKYWEIGLTGIYNLLMYDRIIGDSYTGHIDALARGYTIHLAAEYQWRRKR